MLDPQPWYIVKNSTGTCEIISADPLKNIEIPTIIEQWGPFESRDQAVARRVGLIRSGKCVPR